MNSSADLTISSDWDVIDDEMSQLILNGKKSEEDTSEDLKENVPKGSCVDDIIPSQEVIGTQDDSNVAGALDVTALEINNHNESSSSSEFDVLDEAVEDNQSNLSISHMEYSISSSLESSHPSLVPEAEVEAEPEDETSSQSRSPQDRNLRVHPYLVAVVVPLAIIAIFLAIVPFESVHQMKQRISALQTENDELKNLVQSKLENDKVLRALEEQIKSLKNENFKLSESMKALVARLEEQTLILKKDKETKEQDPYRNVIEKLKEQINILQIDNEELQKQLVRTRYGIYSPHPKEQEANPPVEGKEEVQDKTDNKENRDNSSEILMEKMNELRKKLYEEVDKLMNWKDSVQHLVKKLGKGFAGPFAENGEDSMKNKKPPSSEKMKASKSGKKDKKFPDWSWSEVKKNFKDTFEGLQGMDLHKMISNYMGRKKIEAVFESVNHYFQKAHEKTKKALNFDNDVNEEMWHFFGQLRNQWHDLKNKYFQKHYSTKQAPPKSEDYKFQYHERKPSTDDTHDFQTDKKFDRHEKQKKPKETSNGKLDSRLYPDMESFLSAPTTETSDSGKNDKAPENKEMIEDNSWVFKRAAHRSQLREEEQEAFTNWFLKRGRDFHYNEDESLKEWFKEQYQFLNSDEE